MYVFRSKRADRIKLLFWDQMGMCLLTKRLKDGTFCWPAIQDGVMRLSQAARQLSRRCATHSDAGMAYRAS